MWRSILTESFIYFVSWHVVYVNIRGLHKNSSLLARGGDVFFIETLVSYRRHISQRIVPGLDRPMQLLRGEVDQFQELTVYVRDSYLAYRQRSYECECCEVIVARIFSSSHNICVRRVPESRSIG